MEYLDARKELRGVMKEERGKRVYCSENNPEAVSWTKKLLSNDEHERRDTMWDWRVYLDEMAKESKAYECVKDIICDLDDRRGLGQEFNDCDSDVQVELIDTWAAIVSNYI